MWAAFSPDSSRVAFQTDNGDGSYSIKKMSLAGVSFWSEWVCSGDRYSIRVGTGPATPPWGSDVGERLWSEAAELADGPRPGDLNQALGTALIAAADIKVIADEM